jgi:uncharacterized protein
MKAVLDTGPWVALIDRSEELHDYCVRWFRGYRGELFSTEAVLTEVLYLLNFSVAAQAAALDFVLSGVVVLVPSTLASLERTKEFIQKYANIPMDFTDASLVTLGEDLSIQMVVTFDRKDFGIYRSSSGKPFVILPTDRPSRST